jgi:PAS domain S-box-containing protein
MLRSEFEQHCAALIREIDSVQRKLSNSAVSERLANVKRGIEILCEQIVAEEGLTAKHQQLLEILDSAPIAVAITSDEVVRYANRYISELMGVNVGDRAPDWYVHPSDRDRLIETLHRDGIVRDAEVELYGSNGKIRNVLATMAVVQHEGREGILVWLVDFTERRTVEETLRENQHLLETVLENSAAVIYSKRKDGRYIYVNREYEVACNLEREQVLGKTDFALFPKEIAQQFRTNDLDVMKMGRMTESEERLDTPLGEQVFLSRKVPLTSSNGEVEGICGISTNITDRRRAELALREAIKSLEHERENRLMNLEAITAAIAHEIKQPVAAIAISGSAAVRWLKRAPPNLDQASGALSNLVNNSYRISEAVDAIRSLFQKVDQKRQPIDVNEIALDVLQSLRGELNEHGITVRPQLTSKMPLVNGNRNQLYQVIFNLVHNAVEAMDAITDQNRILQLKTENRDDDAIAIAVQDSGPGIDPNELDKMFNAFVSTKANGMGLGLAICRLIVDRHGGKLTASSDGKNGALFQLILPVHSEEGDAARA